MRNILITVTFFIINIVNVQSQTTDAFNFGISGPTSVCRFSSYVYQYQTPCDNTSVTWTLPPGATYVNNPNNGFNTSITVTFGAYSGILSLTSYNSSGTNCFYDSISIDFYPSPVAISNIQGPSILSCNAQTQTYSVSPVANAISYTWTLPSGATGNSNSNTINVSFSATTIFGVISVAAFNACGQSTNKSLSVRNNPGNPVIVQNGNILHCTTNYNGYQWYDQNGIINGATNQDYIPPQAGTYSLKAYYFSNCISNNSNSISYNPQLPNIYYDNQPDILVGNPVTISPTYVGQVPPGAFQQVSTVAGTGVLGSNNGISNQASFNNPQGITLDSSGVLYVADTDNSLIRKISADGMVSTFAGSTIGNTDGTGSVARFRNPQRLTVNNNIIYVSDTGNNKIRKITSNQTVSTLNIGFATISTPVGITTNSLGDIYVVSNANNKIHKMTPTGVTTTFAGSGNLGFNDGNGTSASFWRPKDICIDNSSTFWVSDTDNNTIRQINQNADVVSYAGVTSLYSFYLSSTLSVSGNYMSFPEGITTDNSYIYFTVGHRILRFKINPTSNSERVTLFAGGGGSGLNYNGDVDAIGELAKFNSPKGMAVDKANGYVYVADSGNHKIRKISMYGYSISPTLPPGLVFNYDTGTISGTPTAPFDSTTYTITAYNQYGNSSATLSLRVAFLNNINIEKTNFTLYPNPAHDRVTIKMGDNLYSSYNVSICNLLGQEVYRTSLQGSETQIAKTWPGSGLYLVKIYDTHNQVLETHKVVFE
jgi:sugar lactone lactonase YvrE